MHKLMFYVVIFVIVISVSCGRGFLVGEQRVTTAAEKAGLQSARIISSHRIWPVFFGCDKHDAAGFKVEGINPNGMKVDAMVCCGWILKGCTMRYE